MALHQSPDPQSGVWRRLAQDIREAFLADHCATTRSIAARAPIRDPVIGIFDFDSRDKAVVDRLLDASVEGTKL